MRIPPSPTLQLVRQKDFESDQPARVVEPANIAASMERKPAWTLISPIPTGRRREAGAWHRTCCRSAVEASWLAKEQAVTVESTAHRRGLLKT